MVIVSNGFGKFPLAVAAAELHERGLLTALITGAYPKGISHLNGSLVAKLPPRTRRLLARRESLPDSAIRSMWLSEVVHEIALASAPWNSARSRRWSAHACSVYGLTASRVIERLGKSGMIYHYRSGFGGRSVNLAKRRGMVALCDHSIAHPAVIDYLIENRGHLPEEPVAQLSDPFWGAIFDDIGRADCVVVPSEFVKTTFVHQGYPGDRVHVIHMGVDDAFLAQAERFGSSSPSEGPTKLLFVGTVERRKGVEVMLEALEDLDDREWELEIVGPFKDGIAERHRRLLGDPRVVRCGTLDRLALAECMSRADIFVFPSLAEGSARVIPMAMACGCFVITTPNSGSVVEHGRHGLIVPPGDVEMLRAAIADAASDRERLRSVGEQNRRFVFQHLRQEQYGEGLRALYRRLQEGSEVPAVGSGTR